jgi:hypothetical protein
MWTEPYFFGGIAGGEIRSQLATIQAVHMKANLAGATIIQGRLFYKPQLGQFNNHNKSKYHLQRFAMENLIWKSKPKCIGASTIYEYQSPNQPWRSPIPMDLRRVSVNFKPRCSGTNQHYRGPLPRNRVFSYDSVLLEQLL